MKKNDAPIMRAARKTKMSKTDHLPVNEFVKTAEKIAAKLQELLRETPLHLPQKHQCPCDHSLKKARFKR